MGLKTKPTNCTTIQRQGKMTKNDVDNNNNKYWNYTEFTDSTWMCEYGRLGMTHSVEYFTPDMRSLNSVIKEKLKKGYAVNDTLDAPVSITVKGTPKITLANIAKKQIASCPITSKLIDDLVQVNIHNITEASSGRITYDTSSGTFKTEQGVIAPHQVSEARGLLANIADYVINNDYDNSDFSRQLSKYLTLVPQNFGMKKLSTRLILPDVSSLQKQNDLLDGLEASYADIVNGAKTDNKDKKVDEPKVFQVKLTFVNDGKIIDFIRNKYKTSRQDIHACSHLDVKNVYTVEISVMADAFDNGKKIGNVMELWHGTKAANLLSILKIGLIIPPSNASHCTGRMFGNGLYFASASTKSLNYAYGYWGGTRNERCFMFVADVAMGKSYIPRGSYESLPKYGYHSTWAKSGQSGVINDEMIVYNTNQANLTYLVEFTPKGR